MIGTTVCPPHEDLGRFLLGQLSEGEARGLEQHLARCPACVARLETASSRDQLVDVVSVVARSARSAVEEVRADLLQALYRLPEGESGTLEHSPHSELSEPWLEALAPAQAADEIGRFGSYGILRLLGTGGMGVVFAARQARPRRVVALKMLGEWLAAPGGRGRRFRSEAEIVARLQHPNIVPIHEVGEQEGRPYFTMEYLAGGSLAQKLAEAPLLPREAAEMVEVLARAVGFANDNGVIHRDLKPSNILLTATGVLKVADFGLAKRLADELAENTEGRTRSGAILGTPAYMAPEQAGGCRGTASPLMDVYSLGAILYECLTGRPPFRAATLLDTLDLVRNQEPLPPARLQPGLPRDLQTICLKCLEKVPARRYLSAVALADDLGRFLRGEPIQARPVSRRERLWKWVRRQPVLASLLGSGVLLLGALIVGALLYESSLREALRQTEASATEARRQQGRADRGYRAASDTLNRMLVRLETRHVGDIPQLKELQRELAEEVLPFFRQSLEEADGGDVRIQYDTARACKRVGDIEHTLGRYTQAGESYELALGLLARLPAEERVSFESRSLAAGCHNNLALLATGRRDSDEAARHHQKALDLREEIARDRPDDLAAQNAVAETAHNFAQVRLDQKRFGEAETQCDRAVRIRTELSRTNPKEERYRLELAQDYITLAEIYKHSGRAAQAILTLEKVEGLLRPILIEHPSRGLVALTLVATNINWSYLLRAEGKNREALVRLNEAVELAEGALRREPRYGFARQQTHNAHGARAQLNEVLGCYADAAKDWDRVIELSEQPNPWLASLFRAIALARSGNAARASAEAEALEAMTEVPAEGRYNLACVHALVAGLDPSLKERSAAHAVALLDKLRKQGYFAEAGQLASLRDDADLNVLRERDDFKKLLRETQASKPDR